MMKQVAIAALVAALAPLPAHGKQSRAACIREMRETFGTAQAKRICDPKNYVSKPDEYGWECEITDKQTLYKVKGRGARLKRDAICE